MHDKLVWDAITTISLNYSEHKHNNVIVKKFTISKSDNAHQISMCFYNNYFSKLRWTET
jgi:hypothetical protein